MNLPNSAQWTAFAAALLVLAIACGGSDPIPAPGQAGATAQAPTVKPTATSIVPEGSSIVPKIVPDVDLNKHNVPIEDILFDTFGTTSARFVPLSEISDELQTDLRDAIIPVDLPVYGASDALPWLEDEDLVLGYESGDETFAYPINILNFHEIVNDNIDGVPVLITYCPLCFSSVVFNREVDGETLTFGNTSALYQSDLVMYDHQTNSGGWRGRGRDPHRLPARTLAIDDHALGELESTPPRNASDNGRRRGTGNPLHRRLLWQRFWQWLSRPHQ